MCLENMKFRFRLHSGVFISSKNKDYQQYPDRHSFAAAIIPVRKTQYFQYNLPDSIRQNVSSPIHQCQTFLVERPKRLWNCPSNSFEAADINGDGRITRDEAMAFDKQQLNSNESDNAPSTQEPTTASTDQLQLLNTISSLLSAYRNQDDENNGISVSV